MTKRERKKDVNVENNVTNKINIKIDGDKSKKKRKRKSRRKAHSKLTNQFGDGSQHRASSVVISNPQPPIEPAQIQPIIIPASIDYAKYSKNYLAIEDKKSDSDKS